MWKYPIQQFATKHLNKSQTMLVLMRAFDDQELILLRWRMLHVLPNFYELKLIKSPRAEFLVRVLCTKLYNLQD